MENSIASQIRNNNFKVYFLIAILTAIIGLLGSLISYYFKWGLTGTGSFLIIIGIIDFIAYFYSDKIILRVTRAKPVTKEQVPEYYEIVSILCAKANIPFPKLYLLDDNTMNAFATGRDYNHSAIAVTKGLLQKMTLDEVAAVIAHELSHIKNYDMRIMAVISILVGAISIIADLYWSSNIVNKAQEKDNSGIIAIIGAILSIFAPLTAFFIQMAISRKREYVADAGSAELTKKPKALASALRKISMDIRLPKHFSASTAHLYFSAPSVDSFIDKLFSTHPPIDERIKLLENI
ncbi:MAG: M48 family metalloprotease [Patescibacteria group bacterium]